MKHLCYNLPVANLNPNQIVVPNDDDPVPVYDLGQTIAEVVRTGARIEISPRKTPYGVVHLTVKVIPPPPAYPIAKVFHTVYEINELAGFLRRARIYALILPGLKPGDQSASPTESPTE
jgi:hypothetical protein